MIVTLSVIKSEMIVVLEFLLTAPPPLCVQYTQAANTVSDVSECEQAKELGAINSTLR